MNRRTPMPPDERVLMDNRRIDVTSAGRSHLMFALALLSNGESVTHVIVDDGDLVLLSHEVPGSKRLGPPLQSLVQITNYVENWLTTEAVYKGHFDDPDILNEPGGFRAWCGQWGQDTKYPSGFARIQARYAWLGK